MIRPPDVRRAHRRQRQRDVVEGDRQLHPREQQLRQRVHVLRVQQRVLDRLVDVRHGRQRLRRVDDAGAEREALQPEAEALVDDQRRGAVVHVEDETGATHRVLLGSKATLTVPRRPAEWAWSSASRQRCSGYVATFLASCWTASVAASSVAIRKDSSRLGRGVGADDLELAEPRGGQVGGRGHPRQHDAAAGAGGVQRGLERLLAADGVDGDVDAAEQVRRGEVGLELEGTGRPAYPPQHLARRDHLGRAELAGELLLVAVLGDHDDLAGVGELAQRERGEEARPSRRR